MKKITVFVVLLIMFSGIFANQSLAAASFKDVDKNNRFYNEIQYLVGENIISGFLDGSFRPKSNVTRAQAAIMIGRASGFDGKPRNTSFKDVKSSNRASGYIAAAKENYLISGYPDGTFKPDKVVTRAEMAIILNKAFFSKTAKPTKAFSDVGKNMSSYYSIMNLAAIGIVSGYRDGTFKPNNNLNREQFAAFLARAFNDDFNKWPDTQKDDVGKIKGTVTWQYNKVIGTKPDTGAKVYLIPTNFKHKSFSDLDTFSSIGIIPPNSNLHFGKVDGYGYYEISDIPAGKYLVIISSKNTTRNIEEKVSFKSTLEPLIGASNYETFELFNLILNKHTWKYIDIQKDKTINVSNDFGYTYF